MGGRRKSIAAKRCQGLEVRQGTEKGTGLVGREEGRAAARGAGLQWRWVSESREVRRSVGTDGPARGGGGPWRGTSLPWSQGWGWRHPKSAVGSTKYLFGTEGHHHCTLASSSSRLLVWIRPQGASRGQRLCGWVSAGAIHWFNLNGSCLHPLMMHLLIVHLTTILA